MHKMIKQRKPKLSKHVIKKLNKKNKENKKIKTRKERKRTKNIYLKTQSSLA